MVDRNVIDVKPRIWGYDLIKSLSIIGIVLYHIKSVDFGTVIEGQYYLPNVAKCFYSLCAASVPLFFMVSGALSVEKRFSWNKTIVKCGRLFFVSFFWGLFFHWGIRKSIFGVSTTLREALTYYWFLNTLAVLYLIAYVLNRVKWLRFLTLAVLCLFPFLTNFFWDIQVFLNSHINIPAWGHTGLFSLYSVVYFYLGAWQKQKTISWQYCLLFIIVGMSLVNFEVIGMSNYYMQVYDGVNSAFPTIGALIMASGFFSLLSNVEMTDCWMKRCITFVGKNTLGVFVIHMIILFAIRQFFSIPILNPFLLIFISLLLVAISSVISEMIKKSVFSSLMNL